ncbi:MAG: phycobilisome linker polypeptide, partial [Cyanobacteriota bacterium]|nr:phycobilisome linker polypeptide [Cyanobacteriota bacterium]
MRVSTARGSGGDDRVFTVVVESFGVGIQRRAERRFTVPFAQLQSLMQTIARSGGRIRVVSSDDASVEAPGSATNADAPSAPPAAAPAEASAKTSKPKSATVSHADVPVNLYKPKDPFLGTV